MTLMIIHWIAKETEKNT